MSMIPIENIIVGKRLRVLNDAAVVSLSGSIRDQGLLVPLLVTPVHGYPDGKSEMYWLVAGNHRLEACKLLGWTEIQATITAMSDIDRELAEIDENYMRSDLTGMQKEEHLAKRKEKYLVKFPETKHGTAGANKRWEKNADCTGAICIPDVDCTGATHVQAHDVIDAVPVTSPPPSFIQDTAQKLGIAPCTVARSVRRATQITPEVRETIRDIPSIANSNKERDALASMPKTEQKAAVEAVKTGKAKSIREITGKSPKKRTKAVAPFQGENCIKDENEPWDIEAVQPPDGLQDAEAVMPPPTPIDWKKVGKEYQTKISILEDEIRRMRSTIRELKKDASSWESRALKAEAELASIRAVV